jgi:hypothetical protein
VSDIKCKIIEASYHRNGISGAPFYAILFEEKTEGTMIASLFDGEVGYCAVYKVSELSAGNITFACGNSWRGDQFESALRPLLKAYLKKRKTT